MVAATARLLSEVGELGLGVRVRPIVGWVQLLCPSRATANRVAIIAAELGWSVVTAESLPDGGGLVQVQW